MQVQTCLDQNNIDLWKLSNVIIFVLLIGHCEQLHRVAYAP